MDSKYITVRRVEGPSGNFFYETRCLGYNRPSIARYVSWKAMQLIFGLTSLVGINLTTWLLCKTNIHPNLIEKRTLKSHQLSHRVKLKDYP